MKYKLTHIASSYLTSFIEGRINLPIWSIIFFIAGIACNLSIGTTISIHQTVLLAISLLAFCVCGYYITSFRSLITFFLIPFILGIIWMSVHIHIILAQKLPYPIYGSHTLQGTIIGEYFSKHQRYILLNPTSIDGQKIQEHAWHVRVKVSKNKNLKTPIALTNHIKIKAYILPPPRPVWPGGYDNQRRAFFTKLAGSGFALTPPTLMHPRPFTNHVQSLFPSKTNVTAFWNSFQENIQKIRLQLRLHFIDTLEAKHAHFASALMIGMRAEIPDKQLMHLRASGLIHLLAISGLHIGIVMGGAFFITRMLMATITPLARKYQIKKIAGFFALLAGLLYLFISGAAVPTQRAFIVGLLAILALTYDRSVLSIRIVAFAAFCVSVYSPWVVMDASFQLSFAAVGALVFAYEWHRDRQKQHHLNAIIVHSFAQKCLKICYHIVFTTLIVNIATQPLIALIFGYITPWSLLANVFAVPIASFIMMPSLFAMLIPGLSSIAMPLFTWSLDLILSLADFIYHLPFSQIATGQINGFTIIYFFITISIAATTYGKSRNLFLIAALIIYPIIFTLKQPLPKLVIGPQGALAAQINQSQWVLLGKSNRGYLPNVWQNKLSLHQFSRFDALGDTCSKNQCRFKIDDITIGWFHTKTPDLALLCKNYDLLILSKVEFDQSLCPNHSAHHVVDQWNIRNSGAQFFNWSKPTQNLMHHGTWQIVSDDNIRGSYPWIGWRFAFKRKTITR